jgi:hypothetical protein
MRSRATQAREGKAELRIRRLVRLPTLCRVLLDHLQVTHAHHPLPPPQRGGALVDRLPSLVRRGRRVVVVNNQPGRHTGSLQGQEGGSSGRRGDRSKAPAALRSNTSEVRLGVRHPSADGRLSPCVARQRCATISKASTGDLQRSKRDRTLACEFRISISEFLLPSPDGPIPEQAAAKRASLLSAFGIT